MSCAVIAALSVRVRLPGSPATCAVSGNGSPSVCPDVEDVRGAEPDDGLRIAVRRERFASCHDRGENRDALFAVPDKATQRTPGLKSRDTRCAWTLTDDQTHVVQGVAMEAAHRFEQRREVLAVTRVERRS